MPRGRIRVVNTGTTTASFETMWLDPSPFVTTPVAHVEEVVKKNNDIVFEAPTLLKASNALKTNNPNFKNKKLEQILLAQIVSLFFYHDKSICKTERDNVIRQFLKIHNPSYYDRMNRCTENYPILINANSDVNREFYDFYQNHFTQFIQSSRLISSDRKIALNQFVANVANTGNRNFAIMRYQDVVSNNINFMMMTQKVSDKNPGCIKAMQKVDFMLMFVTKISSSIFLELDKYIKISEDMISFSVNEDGFTRKNIGSTYQNAPWVMHFIYDMHACNQQTFNSLIDTSDATDKVIKTFSVTKLKSLVGTDSTIDFDNVITEQFNAFLLQKYKLADSFNDVFEIFGDTIYYAYYTENYDCGDDSGSNLSRSCMRSSDHNRWDDFDLYAKNPDKVKMVIILSNNKKIAARCIVWKNNEGKMFFDRIYAKTDACYRKMVKYCEKHKNYINVSESNNGLAVYKDFSVELSYPKTTRIPYTDTLQTMELETMILHSRFGSNSGRSSNNIICLASQNGIPSKNIKNIEYCSDIDGKSYPQDAIRIVMKDGKKIKCHKNEVLYLKPYKINILKSDLGDKYIEALVTNKRDKSYILKEDATYSEYEGAYVYNEYVDKVDDVVMHKDSVNMYKIISSIGINDLSKLKGKKIKITQNAKESSNEFWYSDLDSCIGQEATVIDDIISDMLVVTDKGIFPINCIEIIK